MEFRVFEKVDERGYAVYADILGVMAYFPNTAVGLAMAHDYCDFLNDKYCDKEINEEWPSIDRKERIKYHLNEIEKLVDNKKLHWNEHGNGVE